MSDHGWLNMTGGNLLVVGLPIALALVWFLARRRRLLRSAIKNYPYLSGAIEIALALAIGWSVGTIGEFLRRAIVPDEIQDNPLLVLKLSMYLAVSFSLARLVQARADSLLRRGIGSGMSQLARTFVYGLCLFLGTVIFLATNDFTKLTVVAGGVAAIFSFGLRQTLTDAMSGVALTIERSFRRRDWIMLEDGTAGEVVDTDWRATYLRGWDRAVMLVPNSRLAGQNFRILPTNGQLYAETVTFRISADEDPDHVKSLLAKAAGQCEHVLQRPAPTIRLDDSSSIPYQYSLWVYFDGYMSVFDGREEIYVNVHKVLKEAGIQVAPAVHEIRQEPPAGHAAGSKTRKTSKVEAKDTKATRADTADR